MASSATFTPGQSIQWQPLHHRQRLASMVAAALITLFAASLFNVHPTHPSGYTNQTKSLTAFILNRPIEVATSAKPILPAKMVPQTTIRKKPSPLLRQAPQASAKEEDTTLTKTDITSKEPPTITPSSTPLQWDSKSINKAYNDSKSEIQKMAEASGKEMNTPIKTKYDKFQTAAEQAATPDCLSPQSGGLGLLSIPVIIFAAATDKCKMP